MTKGTDGGREQSDDYSLAKSCDGVKQNWKGGNGRWGGGGGGGGEGEEERDKTQQ